MPKLYRVIVYNIEAIQVTPENVDRAVQWCNGMEVEEIDPFDKHKTVGVNVPTLGGIKRASQGSYITRQNRYGFNVLSKEEFEAKYEQVL